MLRNYSWVIEGALCGLAIPGRLDPLEEDLATLREAGVTLLVTALPMRLASALVLGAAGMRGLHVPIPDFAPATSRQLADFVTRTRAEIDGGGAVAVHCFAGMGRTGMLLASYLAIEHDLDGDAAIKRIREMRPGSIETSEQEDAVRGFVRTFRTET